MIIRSIESFKIFKYGLKSILRVNIFFFGFNFFSWSFEGYELHDGLDELDLIIQKINLSNPELNPTQQQVCGCVYLYIYETLFPRGEVC